MKRVKYISQFAKPMSREDINAIATQAALNNTSLDVTGVLMTSGGLFFQVLEGPEDVVDALYERIGRDPRHTDMLLLKSEVNVSRRIFPNWAMRFVVLETDDFSRLEPLRIILETISEMQARQSILSTALERGLWMELSAQIQSHE